MSSDVSAENYGIPVESELIGESKKESKTGHSEKRDSRRGLIVKEHRCSACGSTDIYHDEEFGESVCRGCGFVEIEEMTYEGPEWRAFSNEERQKRPRATPAGDIGTMFESSDKNLSFEERRKFERLRRWNVRTRYHESWDRNILQATNELDRLCKELNIPAIGNEEALYLYKKVLKAGLVRGRSIKGMVAASLYTIIRKYGYPYTLDNLATVSILEEDDISRFYRLIIKELKLRQPIHDPKLLIPKIASRLKVGMDSENLAHEILEEAQETGQLMGRDPKGMAATALYLACQITNEKRVQKDIAKAARTTEVTIRNRMKDLKELPVYKNKMAEYNM